MTYSKYQKDMRVHIEGALMYTRGQSWVQALR